MGSVEGVLSPLVIEDVAVEEGNDGITDLVFTVTLSQNVSAPFTVDVGTADGTATVANGDYVTLAETLMFAGTTGESKQVTVQVNGDRWSKPTSH